MAKGAVFSARFHVENYEGEQLVQDVWTPNRVLRVGLRTIVTLGVSPSQFSVFAVGDGIQEDSAAIPELGSAIAGGQKAGTKITAPFPQWSYTTSYEAGEGTGLWTEIGMRFGFNGPLLNRALFKNAFGVLVPIDKTIGRRAVVTVLFTLARQ